MRDWFVVTRQLFSCATRRQLKLPVLQRALARGGPGTISDDHGAASDRCTTSKADTSAAELKQCSCQSDVFPT